MEKLNKLRKVRSDKLEFNEKQVNQLESLAGVGMTVEEIGEYFGVSKSTMDRRIFENEIVSDALRRGRTKAQATVYRAAFEMATSKKHSDFTKFYMRSRYGWSEKQDIHITGELNLNPEHDFIEQLKKMDTDELAAFVNEGRTHDGRKEG